jgi:transcriptional regulator with XRE-family HTH domain
MRNGVTGEVDKQIGARLKSRREELRLSQKAVGEMLGVSYQQVQKYEKGKDHLKAMQLRTLSEGLKAPLAYFMSLSGASGFADAGARFVGPESDAPAQARDLVNAFLSIRSQATRDAVIELTRRLAKAQDAL